MLPNAPTHKSNLCIQVPALFLLGTDDKSRPPVRQSPVPPATTTAYPNVPKRQPKPASPPQNQAIGARCAIAWTSTQGLNTVIVRTIFFMHKIVSARIVLRPTLYGLQPTGHHIFGNTLLQALPQFSPTL